LSLSIEVTVFSPGIGRGFQEDMAAMLASKSPFPTAPLGSSGSGSAQYANVANYRSHAAASRSDHAFFASPTESEFSESYDAPDAVRYVVTMD
jgi:hypothetical protein